MLTYYLDLALRSFRSARGLTALMVFAIAMGIGASMTTLATYRALAADPIPSRSGQLFRVELDAAGRKQASRDPDEQLTRTDAEALLREHRGARQAMMVGGEVSVEPARDAGGGAKPFDISARYATADFFTMFDLPLRHGRAWTAAEDAAAAPVVVLSHDLNERLFGGADSVGRTLRFDNADYRVIGVLDAWQPVPYFFDLNVGRFNRTEGLFLPFSTFLDHKLGTNGSMHCWGDNAVPHPHDLDVPCSWVQYWVELDTPAAHADFARYLDQYNDRQRAAGRVEQPAAPRLLAVMDYLASRHVVPGDVRLQAWLAFGFLAVCLVNTVGLLLAKCLRRSPEIGIRRALGASRGQVFAQFLVEAGVIGLAGGELGLVFAGIGVWIVRSGSASRAQWVHLDPTTLATTFVLAIGASLLAGVLPAWRACGVAPAAQLKSS